MSSARDSSAYSFSDKMDIMGKGFTRPFGKIISTLEWPLSAKAASEKTFYGQNEAVNRAASSQLFLQKLSAEDKIAVTTLSGQQGVSLDYIKASQNKPWFLKIDPVSKMDGKPSKGKWAATFIAFGQHAGGSPLYVNQDYRFKVKIDNAQRNRTIILKVYDVKTFELIQQERYQIPEIGDSIWVKDYLENGRVYEHPVNQAYGFSTKLSFTEDSNEIIITHRSDSHKYAGIVQIEQNQELLGVYSLDFSQSLPWQLAFLQKPTFHAPLHDVETRLEKQYDWLKMATSQLTLALPDEKQVALLKSKIESPELFSHPILDQLVLDLNRDPMAIASFVQNEIELIQGIRPLASTADYVAASVSAEINPGKMDRSALTVLLEGQGNPWEQSALLIYLLRKAGYAAAYATLPPQSMLMPEDRASNMLGLQLKKALVIGNYHFYNENNPGAVFINYPWVVFYDETARKWIHLFPWLQENHIVEGHDAYSFLPLEFRTAGKWIYRYLQNDPNITKHIGPDGNDTAAVLFKRFLQEHLRKQNKTLDDVGINYYPQKRQYAAWDEFPKPDVMVGKVILLDSLKEKAELFTMLQVEVSSIENPNKKLKTALMRVMEVNNRPFYVDFRVDNSWHEMRLTLLPYPSSNSQELGQQELSLKTNRTDRNFKIRILYEQNAGSSRTPIEYNIEKGVTAAICARTGRVTSMMLDMHALSLEEKSTKEDRFRQNGVMAYLTGMNYFKKLSDSEKFLRGMHKVYNIPFFSAGLSKLSPDMSSRSTNISSQGDFIGEPVLKYPQVDMNIFASMGVFNNSVRPDIDENSETIMNPFYEMIIVDGSANEHQVLNDIYKDRHAISTVKLLQLTQASSKRFLTFTQSSFVQADQSSSREMRTLKQQAGSQWSAAAHALGYDLSRSRVDASDVKAQYAIAYMTPGFINSNDDPNQPSYKGMGTLIFSTSSWSALISGNKNNVMYGGYGSRLPENTFGNFREKPLYVLKSAQNEYSMGGLNRESRVADNYGTKNAYYDTIKEQTIFAENVNSSPKFNEPKSSHKYYGNSFQKSWEPKADAPFVQAETPRFREESNPNQFAQTFPKENQDRMAKQSRARSSSHEQVRKNVYNDGALHQETQGSHQNIFERVADPVNIINGAFYLDELDITLPGIFALEIRRNYSSENALPGDFGYGWKSNLVSYLALVGADDKLIHAAEADGTVLVYRREPKKALWHVHAKDNPRLSNYTQRGIGGTANAFHNQITKHDDKEGLAYHLQGSDGSLRVYLVKSYPLQNMSRKRPYLATWSDPFGNQLRFLYGEDNAQNDFGKIRRVESDNNALMFSYDSEQRITRILAVDGRILKYSYDAQGDLVQVVRPDNSVVEYKYEVKVEADEENLVYSSHRLMEEIKPGDRRLVNEYDEEGRVISQRATAVSDQSGLFVNAQFIYTKATKEDLFAETIAVAPNYLDEGKDSSTYYKIYDGLIYQIIDPAKNIIYQSWYLDEKRYFDAETKSVAEIPVGAAKGYARSLKDSIDKRGLKTSYTYDQNGNPIIVEVQGLLKTYFVYDPQTHLLLEESYQLASGTLKCTTFSYDASQLYLLKKIENLVNGSAQKTIAYDYDLSAKAKGLIKQETLLHKDQTRITKHFYDSNGFEAKRIQTGKKTAAPVVHEWHYNRLGQVSEVINSGRDSIHYTYDIQGRATKIVHQDKIGTLLSHVEQKYNQNGEIIQKTFFDRKLPHSTFYNYDHAGRLIAHLDEVIDSKTDDEAFSTFLTYSYQKNHLATTLYHYSPYGNLLQKTDANGYAAFMKYDAMGRMVSKVQGEQQDKFAYEPGGKLSKWQELNKNRVQYVYTQNGLLKQRINSDESVDEWTYDEEGRVTKEVVNGITWVTEYDDDKLTERRYHPESGVSMTSTFDAEGNLLRFVDAAGYAWQKSYDDLGRLLEEKTPCGGHDQYEYDNSNYRVSRINALGEKTFSWADGLGRSVQTEILDSAGKRVFRLEHQYDPDRVLSFYGDPKSARGTSLQMFDYQGRVLLFEGNSHRSYKYDKAGNLKESEDGLSHRHEYAYSNSQHLSQETLPSGAAIKYQYDATGNLQARELPGGYLYDAAYNQDNQISTEAWSLPLPTGGQVKWSYAYAQNRLDKVTDAKGNEQRYFYDSLGRIQHVDSLKDRTSYVYDARGLLQSITQSVDGHVSVVARDYDGCGHLIHESVSLDGEKTQDFEQTFDEVGRRATLTQINSKKGFDFWTWFWGLFGDSNKAADFSFSYDALKRLTKVRAKSLLGDLTYEYDADGVLIKRQKPWGTVSVTERDVRDRVSERQVHSHGALLFTETLEWLNTNQLSSYRLQSGSEDLLSNIDQTYSYDDLSRLVGQKSHESRDTLSKTFLYDQGKAGVGMATFATEYKVVYDHQGRVVQRENIQTHVIQELTWNTWGRLSKVIAKQESQILYEWTGIYDGLGRRIKTVFSPSNGEENIRISQYDPQVEFLEIGFKEQQKNQQIQFWKIYGPDLNGVYGDLQGIGGLEALVNENTGEIQATISDAFGHVLGLMSEADGCQDKTVIHRPNLEHWGVTDSNQIGWRGKSLDPTGFYYLGARYYDPQTAGFISPDPLGFAAGMNLYGYAYNDPVNYLDPDGRYATPVWESTKSTVANPNLWFATLQTGAGMAQFVTGAGAALAAGTATGGAAWILGAVAAVTSTLGADNILTGTKSAYSGQHQTTNFHQAMRDTGFSPETSTYLNMGADFFSTLGAGAATSYARGAFSSSSAAEDLTRVGRWMSEKEYNLMRQTGRVVEGGGGQTFVSTKGHADFMRAVQPGSIYAEFEVSKSSLLQGGKDGWLKMLGPGARDSQLYMLQKQGGQILPKHQNLSPILQRK